MSAHRGRIHEHAARSGEGLGLEIFPEPLPDAARLPTPEAHVNRVPVAEWRRQIAPGAASALEMENRFEKLPIRHFAWRTGRGVFGCRERLFELGPDFVGDDLAHRMLEHPKFQSVIAIIVQN